jgi:hypothetical protein
MGMIVLRQGSNDLDEPTLGIATALDVSLCGGKTGMSSQLLDISDAPAHIRYFPCSPRDKRPTTGM